MRTIPRSLFKSYTKDLSFPIFELVFQYRLLPLSRDRQYRYNIMILAVRLLLCMITPGKSIISSLSSMDSGLEAFQP